MPTITIGAQQGTLTHGQAGRVTFAITTTNMPNGVYYLHAWRYVAARTDTVPAGITRGWPNGAEFAPSFTINNGTGTIAIDYDPAVAQPAAAGTYALEFYVDVNGQEVRSSEVRLTISSAPVTQNHTVTFNLDGGVWQGLNATQQIAPGGTVTTPGGSPTRPNHNFAGWFNAAGTQFNLASPITANQVLTAGWTATGGGGGGTAPTLTATATVIGVNLDWTPATAPLGYRVFRATAAGGEGISISDFPIRGGMTFDVNVRPNTAYYYHVRAVLTEARFDAAAVVLTPETLGPRSNEVRIAPGIITADPVEPGWARHFIMMTINDPNMTIGSAGGQRVQEIDPGHGTTPIIVEGRTFLPIRAVVEAMDGAIEWYGPEQRVSLERAVTRRGAIALQMWIGRTDIRVNNEQRTLDVAPFISNTGRTMLPVRFVADNLDAQIEWIGSQNRVISVFDLIDR